MVKEDDKLEILRAHIGKFVDFPKKGIIYKDIFTALANAEVCKILRELLVSHARKSYPNIDIVVGLESRGFLFSFLLATELGCGCVPVRKKGKLPGECFSVEYALEYGTDKFEMQKGSIKPGQKVLIVDDLLATGGSIDAATRLIRKAGGEVVEALVIMELSSLKARKKLDCEVHSLIKYDD